MAKIQNRGWLLRGTEETKSSEIIISILWDALGKAILAKGATVPTNTTAGYAVGCLFIDTTSGKNVTLYVNEGSTTSCTFVAVKNSTLTSASASPSLSPSASPSLSPSLSPSASPSYS